VRREGRSNSKATLASALQHLPRNQLELCAFLLVHRHNPLYCPHAAATLFTCCLVCVPSVFVCVRMLQGVLVDALLPLCPDPSTLAAAAAAPGATTSSSSATTGLLAPTTASGRPPSGPSSGSTGQTLTWSKLRALGAGLWLTDPGALRSTGEALARAQYAASKDPHDCALLYIALGKKQLVQGLFKSAGNKKVGGGQAGRGWDGGDLGVVVHLFMFTTPRECFCVITVVGEGGCMVGTACDVGVGPSSPLTLSRKTHRHLPTPQAVSSLGTALFPCALISRYIPPGVGLSGARLHHPGGARRCRQERLCAAGPTPPRAGGCLLPASGGGLGRGGGVGAGGGGPPAGAAGGAAGGHRRRWWRSRRSSRRRGAGWWWWWCGNPFRRAAAGGWGEGGGNG
jgi:hypothetical protein